VRVHRCTVSKQEVYRGNTREAPPAPAPHGSLCNTAPSPHCSVPAPINQYPQQKAPPNEFTFTQKLKLVDLITPTPSSSLPRLLLPQGAECTAAAALRCDVHAIQWSPTNGALACGGADGRAHLLKPTGELLGKIPDDANAEDAGRGLHSSTCQLNIALLVGQGAFRGSSGSASGGVEGVFWRLGDVLGVINGSGRAEKWMSVSPWTPAVAAPSTRWRSARQGP